MSNVVERSVPHICYDPCENTCLSLAFEMLLSTLKKYEHVTATDWFFDKHMGAGKCAAEATTRGVTAATQCTPLGFS